MRNIADTIGAVKEKLAKTFEVWRPSKPRPLTGQELQEQIDDANGLLDIMDSRGIDAIRRRLRKQFDEYDSYLRNMDAKEHQSPTGTEAKGMARATERSLKIFNDILEEGRSAEATLQSRQEEAARRENKSKASRVHPISSVRSNRPD